VPAAELARDDTLRKMPVVPKPRRAFVCGHSTKALHCSGLSTRGLPRVKALLSTGRAGSPHAW
jgi:hypothetical protein